MRQFALTTAQGGINRHRDKGGASKDSLYDLVNGYVTETNSIKFRPGTRRAYSLPPDQTKGMCAFQDKLHVFAWLPVTYWMITSSSTSCGTPRQAARCR